MENNKDFYAIVKNINGTEYTEEYSDLAEARADYVNFVNNETEYIYIALQHIVICDGNEDITDISFDYSPDAFSVKLNESFLINVINEEGIALLNDDEDEDSFICGMTPARYYASVILSDSPYEGNKYYEIEDELAEEIHKWYIKYIKNSTLKTNV